MSYCRFSSDDFQCDLYIYESEFGGFVTHVAKRRAVYRAPLPKPVPFDETQLEAWLVRHRLVMAMHEAALFVPIDAPHAGATFFDETLSDLQGRLGELKRLGYRYPESVDAALAAERAAA